MSSPFPVPFRRWFFPLFFVLTLKSPPSLWRVSLYGCIYGIYRPTSTLASVAAPLHPLTREDPSSFLALDMTMSFTSLALSLSVKAPSPAVPMAAFPPALATIDSSSSLASLPSRPPAAALRPAVPFKLPEMKDAKAHSNLQDLIRYYLCLPEYSTKRLDNTIVTNASNLEASVLGKAKSGLP